MCFWNDVTAIKSICINILQFHGPANTASCCWPAKWQFCCTAQERRFGLTLHAFILVIFMHQSVPFSASSYNGIVFIYAKENAKFRWKFKIHGKIMQGAVHQNKSPLITSHFYFEGVEKNISYGKCCTPAATRPENRLRYRITGFMQQSWHSPWWCGRGCWGGAAAEACSGSECGSWGWSSSGGNCEEHLWAKANTRNHDCSSKITSRSIKSISVEH